MERIDKLLSGAGLLTRREAKDAARRGRVAVNGVAVSDAGMKIADGDELTLDGAPVDASGFYGVVMNKPAGYVCSTDDPSSPTVMSLLRGSDARRDMFPVGRLDKYTVGLLLISNDGALAHSLLSPKKHVEKRYFFTLEHDFAARFAPLIADGIELGGGVRAKPASVDMQSPRDGYITVTEGMFHLVKRIFEAADNKVVYLRRVAFGPLTLDGKLREGEYRPLTDDEKKALYGVV